MRTDLEYRRGLKAAVMIVGSLLAALAALVLLPAVGNALEPAVFLSFHALVEVVVLVLAALVFTLGWAGVGEARPRACCLAGGLFAGVALLELAHLMSIPGMPDFFTLNSQPKAYLFFVSARLLAALAVLCIAWGLAGGKATGRQRVVIIALTLAYVGSCSALIFMRPDLLLTAVGNGDNPTVAMAALSWTIIGLNVLAAAMFYRRSQEPLPRLSVTLFAASGAMAVSQMFFVIFPAASEPAHLAGHIATMIAYWMIVRALFLEGVKTPYLALTQSLSRLSESESRFRSLTEMSSDWYWEHDAEFRFTAVSGGVNAGAGYTESGLLGKHRWEIPGFIPLHGAWDDHRAMLERHEPFRGFVGRLDNVSGPVVYLSIDGIPAYDAAGCFLGYRGIARDVTSEIRARRLGELERRILQLTIENAALPVVLETLISGMENVVESGMIGSVLLLDDTGERLLLGAAPGLPDDYNAAIHGMRIGPGAGSCGTACFGGKRVIVSDTAKDPLWKDFRSLAFEHGLRACWSEPIRGRSARMLGTFAFYYREPRSPGEQELTMIETAGRLAAVAIENHRAGDAMRASEQRLQLALDSSGQALFDWNVASGEVYLSENWSVMLGGRREPVRTTYAELAALTHPDERAGLGKMVTAVLKGTAPDYRSEHRVRRYDGSWLWIKSHGCVVLRDDTGRALRALGTNDDLSAFKQAEQALRDSEMRYRELFALSPLPMWVRCSETLRFLAVNDAAVRIYGYTQKEFLAMTTWELQPPGEEEAYRKVLSRQVANPHRVMATGRHRVKDGTVIEIEVSSYELSFDGRPARLSIVADISERKRAESRLHAYVARLEALRQIDAAILAARSPRDVASTCLELTLRMIPCRSASVMLFDYQTERLNMLASERIAFIDYPPVPSRSVIEYGAADFARLQSGQACIVNDAAATEGADPVLSAWLKRGMRAYARMPLMVEGIMVGVLNLSSERRDYFVPEYVDFLHAVADHLALALQQSILRDQIEQQSTLLERRVTERTSALESANNELQAFSYSVSHDLRAPLRSIDSFSKLLQDELGTGISTRAAGLLQRVRSGSQRMAELIDDMLSLSRVSRQAMRRSAVDLSAMAREIVAELQRMEPTRQVEVQIMPDITVSADRGLLRILLENLIGNAWKYTGRTSAPWIEIGHRTEQGRHIIHVRDNGVGFDMAYSGKLFGVFQRLHGNDEFEGTGIGLATVKRIIDRHGGTVWAQAAPDAGAAFNFTLGISD